jgi:hypothetical protein
MVVGFIRRNNMFISGLGATFFGLIVGWIAYWILRLRAGAFVLSALITIIGVIGGAAVIALFKDNVMFGWYSVGLVIGFFAYFAVVIVLYGQQEVQPWRFEQIAPPPPPAPPSSTSAPPAPLSSTLAPPAPPPGITTTDVNDDI